MVAQLAIREGTKDVATVMKRITVSYVFVMMSILNVIFFRSLRVITVG